MRPRFSGCLRACDPLQGCVPVISTRTRGSMDLGLRSDEPSDRCPQIEFTRCLPASNVHVRTPLGFHLLPPLVLKLAPELSGVIAAHMRSISKLKLRPPALPPATILPAVLLSKGSCESLGKGARPIGFANALEANNALIGSDQIRMSTDAVQMLSSLNAGLFRPWSSNPAR